MSRLRINFARRIASGDPSLRVYAILDAESCARRGLDLGAAAAAWRDAGIKLLQYRDKLGSDADVLRHAGIIATTFRSEGSILLLNDRTHLLRESGWDGVHIGQTDGGVAHARQLAGDDAIIGLSTHTPEQAEIASREDVDYIATGPVFTTGTKLDAEPVIGLCGLQAARALTQKPLVAIGGITLTNVAAVRTAGADSIALISALLPPAGSSPDALIKSAQDILAAFK